MISLKKKMLMAGVNVRIKPQDVFATSLYTGNGGTQTITNGLDLAGKGGLVWTKNRVTTSDPQNRHRLYDSLRGINVALSSNNTNAEQGLGVFSSWNADGFILGGGNPSASNVSGEAYAAWSFRRSKKFFDIVTYTGDGVAGRQIPHGLGTLPGMIVVKARNGTTPWGVYHRSLGAGGYMLLNTTGAYVSNSSTWVGEPSSASFTVGSDTGVNGNGVQYVAYLFAQNPDLIDCGSYVGNGASSGPQVTCGKGWQPQFLLIKTSTATGDWMILDSKRGFQVSLFNDARLSANLASAEDTSNDYADLTSTGFRGKAALTNAAGNTYIYLAIRGAT